MLDLCKFPFFPYGNKIYFNQIHHFNMYIPYGYAFRVGSSQMLHRCPIIFMLFPFQEATMKCKQIQKMAGKTRKHL